jgi:ubiquinone/menaquinone biosynthesis C-methylase UbiE
MLFDESVAARYDQFCQTAIGAYVDQAERALLWPLLALAPNMSVVDLGCGTGAYDLPLADAGCDVTGVDISPAMLAVARVKRPRQGMVRWIEADLGHLPFVDGSFDRGLLQVTLEFVDDPPRVLHEAARVIRPGGRLVVGLILATGPWAALYRKRGRQEPYSVWRHARFYETRNLAAWMGRGPDIERRGLWVGPEHRPGVEEAWRRERSAESAKGEASFAALAWLL